MFIICNSSMQYVVDRQMGKSNLLLHLHGNTEHLYIVDSYIYVSNNKNRMYCCISMATAVQERVII